MEFYGLVGEKLSHSLSPDIHKRVFEVLDIEGAYKLFEIPNDDIKNLGQALKTLSIKGVNVTIPYKQTVIEQMDYISKEARDIGAINTIKVKNGKLEGYNTDYFGFGKLLEVNGIEVKGKVAVVLGTGGASKAINTYLLDNGVSKLYLVSRNKDVNLEFDSRINLIDYNDLLDIKGDVLVNTTPVGMYPKVGVSPVTKEVINNFSSIVDIIYNPKVTEIIRIGQELGKKVCSGLYMLVGQAIKSQEIWQEKEIDKEIIDEIYLELDKKFV